nr:amiloride-sensitive sodium channel subunit alpha-like [Biomphalaria glabrata]
MKIDVMPISPEASTDEPPLQEETQTERTLSKSGPASDTDTKQTLVAIALTVSEFFQNTSINGPLFIVTSSSKPRTFFWTVLFVGAVVASILHFYYVTAKYLSYKTKTTVERDLEEHIQFPFVTFCNMNLIRKSKLNETSPSIVHFVETLQLENVLKIIPNTPGWTRSDETHLPLEYLNKLLVSNVDPNQTSSSEIKKGFWPMMARLDKKTRLAAGHQLEDMYLWCMKYTDSCNTSKFFPFFSNNFGNCFTLNTTSFMQEEEGSYGGLDIGLFLEPDEYVSELTETKGVQIVLHNSEIYPYPEEDGFQILAGTQTNIALKLTESTFLPPPYGDCVESLDQEYLQKYKFAYSYYLCSDLCQSDIVLQKCQCKDREDILVFEILNSTQNLSLCSEDIESQECYDTVIERYPCACKQKCSANTFTYRITSSKWPSYATARYLLEYLCDGMARERCDTLRNQSEQNLQALQGRAGHDSHYKMGDEVMPVNVCSQSMSVPQIKEDRPEDGTREMCETARDTEPKQTVSPIASVTSEFFQQTSINGPIFINSSSSKQKKVCWSLLFVFCVAASIFHFYYVIDKYLSYKTKTTVLLSKENEIQLPFVTFCNRNAIRNPKNNASDIRNGFLEKMAELDK